MVLKRHHKIIIGTSTLILIIFMAATGILLHILFVQQSTQFNHLNDQIIENQKTTQNQINLITDNLLATQQNITQTQLSLEQSKTSFENQIDILKASAGEDFSGILASVITSVVTIKTDSAQGTGFIINENGYIVTNAHVLADDNGHLAGNIRAITSDQNIIPAQFIGYDGEMDLALLKIPGTYNKLILGDSSQISVGEKVVAIGNPLGLQFSVTEGIISAIHRPGSNGINAYLQTDASLNPGNSGGPLIDKQGKVVGINNFKIGSGESLGFSLESNYIKTIINSIAQENLNQTIIG